MIERVIINNISLEGHEGVLLDGSLEKLFYLPPIVPPEQNDWEDEDGLDVDLSEHLQIKERALAFDLYLSNQAKAVRLYASLKSRLVSTLQIKGCLVSIEREQVREGVSVLYVKAMSIPQEPQRDKVSDMPAYHVEQRGEVLLRTTFDVKGFQNINNLIGTFPSNYQPLKKARQIQVPLLIWASDWTELKSHYDNLLTYLTSKGEKTFTIEDKSYTAYYLSSECRSLNAVSGGLMWELSLNLQTIR